MQHAAIQRPKPAQTAQGFGSAESFGLSGTSTLSLYRALYAQFEPAVFVVIVTCATWLMLANASPRKPYLKR